MEYYPVYYFHENTNLSAKSDQRLSHHSSRSYLPSMISPSSNIISKSKSHHMVDSHRSHSNYKNLNFSNMSSITLNKHRTIQRDRNLAFNSQILLRRLGQNERIFHGQNDFSRSYIYRTVIITSEIDLYANLNIVYQALAEWKRIHPLLRCKVFTKPDPQNPTFGLNKEKYFGFADDAKINSFDNVNFLTYNSHSERACEDVWKLLVEKETTIPLDGENGLLWRLTFFQIKTITKPGHNTSYLYACTITFDHSIMDGRSSYSALLHLFAIIEDMYKLSYNYQAQKEFMVLPSKEDIYRLKRQTPHTPAGALNYIKAPYFLDIDNAIRTSYIRLKYLSTEEENFGIIYTHDKKPYVTVKELVAISKVNNSKFRTLVIQKNDLNRILKRCKENGVKLTTFLNMCLVLALRMLHEKYHQQQPIYMNNHANYIPPVINYTTNISLREFPEYMMYDPEKNYVGCYIGLSFTSFRDNLFYYNNPNWIREFWHMTKRESNDFHDRLNQGEFIHSINLPAKKKERDEFFYHFGNSNLGVLQSSLDDRRLIRIRQAFATGRYSRENFLCWFSNLLATVDNQLCWTVSYNTFFIKQEIINSIIDNLTKIIKELIK